MSVASSDPRKPSSAGPAGLLLGAMAGSLVAARFETVAACIGAAVIGAMAGGVRRPRASWIRALVITVALAFVLNLFLTPGRPVSGLELGGLRATHEGLRQGTLLGLRLLGATGALWGLAAVWSKGRAAEELSRLARPLERLGAPVGEARVVIALALRFAPLLGDEARRIAKAQDLRAGRPPGGLWERLQRRRAVVIPTMVGALERAERTALAMEARHYQMRPIVGAHPLAAGWGISGIVLLGITIAWRG